MVLFSVLLLNLGSAEVPACHVVVEMDALGAAELGDDLHDLILLLWRKQVFTMMIAVIRATAATKE